MNDYSLTVSSQEDFERADKTIKILYPEKKDRGDIFSATMQGEVLTIRFKTKEDEPVILPEVAEYEATLLRHEYRLKMIIQKHVGEPIFPPKQIIISCENEISFANFRKVTFN